MAGYSVGSVYRDATGRLFLAVSHKQLLCCNSRGRPRPPVVMDEDITTRGLAEEWGLTIEELDRLVKDYFPFGK